MRIPICQIDAFADRPFTGNPAAVMPLDHWLDDDVLLAIAAENNLSETAYLLACSADDADADFDLRWFTPAAEVALCGHATLAAGHYILSADPARAAVRFRTRQAGILTVSRRDSGYAMALPSWAPSARPLDGVAAALGVDAPVAMLWHEKGYALIIAASAAIVLGLTPDQRTLAAQGPIVAIVSARGVDTDIVSRVFTPAYGIDEDPVTGSAHAVCVPYWAGVLGRDSFTAYQASKRGGSMTCQFAGDSVILGGACRTVLEGTFLL